MSLSQHSFYVLREIAPACLLAGIGMIFAGCFVGIFKETYLDPGGPNLFEVIPPILGLKGNLEVALSSGLSTMANMPESVGHHSFWLFSITLAFIQVLAVSASVVIPIVTVSAQFLFFGRSYVFADFIHLTSVSSLTCIVATFMISFVVYAAVHSCAFLGANPDNVAPPLAAALGDLCTVLILSCVNQSFLNYPNLTSSVSLLSIVLVFSICLGYLRYNAKQDIMVELQSLSITPITFVQTVPILILAIIMSSISGNILAQYITTLPILTRLQVPINGVGGCFASMLISRMTTQLHCLDYKNTSVNSGYNSSVTPEPHGSSKRDSDVNLHSLFQKVHNSDLDADAQQISNSMLWICVPIHSVLALISLLVDQAFGVTGSILIELRELIAYLLTGFIQIGILLRFSRWIVFMLLDFSVNGRLFNHSFSTRHKSLAFLDLSAISLTTGLGDVLGTVLFIFVLSQIRLVL